MISLSNRAPWGGAFVVPGGLGIRTDGSYYWRADAADYVEHYGVGLPEELLRHGRSSGWHARPMAEDDIPAIYEYLMKHARRVPGAPRWRSVARR